MTLSVEPVHCFEKVLSLIVFRFLKIPIRSCRTGVSRHLHPVLFDLINVCVWLCIPFTSWVKDSRESDHFSYISVNSIDEVDKSCISSRPSNLLWVQWTGEKKLRKRGMLLLRLCHRSKPWGPTQSYICSSKFINFYSDIIWFQFRFWSVLEKQTFNCMNFTRFSNF